MLTYRAFRNSDPPALVSLWQSRAGQSGLQQPVSPDLLEQLNFAKLYFDPQGLFLALDDGRPIGFAHAGFGPNAERTWISTDVGATCVVLVRPDCPEAEVASGLVERCEDYLRRRGAKVLYGGGLAPMNPFYVGLYGGSDLPGILDSDTVARQAFAARGYQEVERLSVLRCELNRFESIVDRRQMQVRRQMLVEVVADAVSQNWWEACTIGEFDLTRFDLVPRVGGSPVASAVFRCMEPAGISPAYRANGLMNITVDEGYRRRGLSLFLLSEAFRQFQRQGIQHVETQVRQNDTVILEILHKLGFRQTEQGGVWQRDA